MIRMVNLTTDQSVAKSVGGASRDFVRWSQLSTFRCCPPVHVNGRVLHGGVNFKRKGGAIEGTKSIECDLHLFGAGDLSVCRVVVSISNSFCHLYRTNHGMLL